jgi:two-component system LytT family sensor kinase
MFQNYQLKWSFILIGILVVGTGLVKLSSFETFHLLQFVGSVFSIFFSVLISWLIIGYFKRHSLLSSTNANATLSIALSILALLLFTYVILINVPTRFYLSDLPYEPTIADLVRRGVGIFFLTMICYVVYSTLFTHEILQKTKLENEQFKQAHLRAQLLSLQEQVSPHFLFNSLSTLKTITHEADTKQFVVHLSHVYRYLLNINKHQTTAITEELKFVHAYLYILHTRFENALKVSINIPDVYNDYLIPPLSIQLLIENAIKHNVVSEDMPLHIEIYVNGQQELVVNNPFQPKNIPVESTKMGLQNINDRYRLLFNQEIVIAATKSNFTITLPLINHESNHH